jgi:hypothetical protein
MDRVQQPHVLEEFERADRPARLQRGFRSRDDAVAERVRLRAHLEP